MSPMNTTFRLSTDGMSRSITKTQEAYKANRKIIDATLSTSSKS